MPAAEIGLLLACRRAQDRYMRMARRAACRPPLTVYMTLGGLELGENMGIFMALLVSWYPDGKASWFA